jgi:hypothetical protein
MILAEITFRYGHVATLNENLKWSCRSPPAAADLLNADAELHPYKVADGEPSAYYAHRAADLLQGKVTRLEVSVDLPEGAVN